MVGIWRLLNVLVRGVEWLRRDFDFRSGWVRYKGSWKGIILLRCLVDVVDVWRLVCREVG